MLRIGFAAAILLGFWATSGCWTRAVGRSLVCRPSLAPSQAILIENFDPDYLLFERAAKLRQAGYAPRVLVPVWTDRGTRSPNDVFLGFAEVMARISRLGDFDVVPVREEEPITLMAAKDVTAYLLKERIGSVIIVTPMFRSRRSALVSGATLQESGVVIHCQPVQGSRGVDTWTNSLHGVQQVAEQWMKLQYYRFYVLPFLNDASFESGGR